MWPELLDGVWAMDERGLPLRAAALQLIRSLPAEAVAAGASPAAAGMGAAAGRIVDQVLAEDPELRAMHAQLANGTPGEAESSPIRVINIFGMLQQHPSWATYYGLATSCDEVQLAVRRFVADPQVQGIMLRIYSPGGNVHGVQALADVLLQGRKEKPIWAHADSMANSGAYWIGASCSRFSASPLGEVGSIGAFMVHTSWQKADEMAGIKSTIIRAGKMKAGATPYEDLTPEATANLQARIDTAYAAFVSGVAKGLGVPIDEVRNGMGQGAAVDAKAGLDMKMIHDVAPFPETLAKLVRELRSKGGSKGGTKMEEPSPPGHDLELLRYAAEFGVLDRVMTEEEPKTAA